MAPPGGTKPGTGHPARPPIWPVCCTGTPAPMGADSRGAP